MGTAAKLTPLLVAALVIQSLVSLVPHRHGPAEVGGGSGTEPGDAVTVVVRVDVPHRCLACAVHAPAVHPADRLGITADPEIATAISDDRSAHPKHPPIDITNPRGPPGIA